MHYRCNLCVHFTCETLRSLINHLGRVHSSDNGFHVLCGIDGCSRTYTNFYSLRNHFHEKHSLVLRTEEGYQARADGVNANNEVNNINQQNNGDDLGDDGGEDFNFEHEVQANQRANALGLLKVKEEKKVPQTVIDSMVKTITMIVDNSVNLLQAATEQLLSDAGLRVENIPGLNELFDESCTIRKPFVECQNDASQLAYLNELNKRISTYDYGYHNDSNKPATILRAKLLSADNNLKQHANEMWCLALYLPLLIAEYIPEDDDHWKAYITLLEITRIVFAPVVSKQQMPYLQILIQQHHKYFKELYPECSIIPKMHYMIHMPRTILRLGPLARSWCMRYEAKHSYFKHLAVSSGNFINLPYSLAKRHQEGLCYRIHTPEGSHSTFLSKGNESGPGTQTYAGNVDYRDKLQRSCNFTEVHLQTRIFEAKWVIIGGTKYKINAILHIGYDEDDFPIFWKIHKICIVENNISAIQFVVWPMDTISFERHWQCYEVGFPVKEQMEIRQHQDFSCYIPKHICKPYGKQGGSRFICTRYDHGTSN